MEMEEISQTIYGLFKQSFRNEPILVRAPGRVNLLGEHTDYNDGFALPAAIDKAIVLALAPNGLKKIRLKALDMNNADFETELSGTFVKSGMQWPDYILGVVDQLQKNGYSVGGFDCVFGGNIPIGAGLSSSAALEGGIVFGLSRLFDLPVSKLEMAGLSQKAENEFVGMQCGIMDQFASIHGNKGSVIKLDCRSLEFEFYPFRNRDIQIILCDTGVHRELTSSEYNIRREQCERGVKILQKHHPDIKSLRDAGLPVLERFRKDFDPVVYKRCKFVLEENKRVEAACSDLLNDDFKTFGRRMYESHNGLRNLYEVSCRELDILVEAAKKVNGVYGARMMGGGFGGCTINLIEKKQAGDFVSFIEKEYREKTGRKVEIYHASISDGTKQIMTESFV